MVRWRHPRAGPLHSRRNGLDCCPGGRPRKRASAERLSAVFKRRAHGQCLPPVSSRVRCRPCLTSIRRHSPCACCPTTSRRSMGKQRRLKDQHRQRTRLTHGSGDKPLPDGCLRPCAPFRWRGNNALKRSPEGFCAGLQVALIDRALARHATGGGVSSTFGRHEMTPGTDEIPDARVGHQMIDRCQRVYRAFRRNEQLMHVVEAALEAAAGDASDHLIVCRPCRRAAC